MNTRMKPIGTTTANDDSGVDEKDNGDTGAREPSVQTLKTSVTTEKKEAV